MKKFRLINNDELVAIASDLNTLVRTVDALPAATADEDGNCYFFALILLDRFPIGKILYDVIDGHFVCEIDGVKYDWSGVVEETGEHHWVEWDKFYEYDNLQHARVVKDCTKT